MIVGGVEDPPGDTMLAKARWLEAHGDALRRLVLREPRGYPALCANLIVAPTHPDADVGFIVMEQTEYPPMSGSNTICVVTAVLETGIVPMTEPITELIVEAPAGLVGIRAECRSGKVTAVSFRNVPSFAAHLDAVVDVPHLGSVTVDIAWGGMFYVIADADSLGVDLDADNGAEIARTGELIRAAAAEQLPVAHPVEPTITGPTISQLSGAATSPGADRRNAVTLSTGTVDFDRPDTWTGALDRCPCGTGTAAKMAVLHARGELDVGQPFVHEGPLGTTFTGHIVETTTVGDRPAIVPEITGTGWITGVSELVVDPTDPFPEGYTIGDLW